MVLIFVTIVLSTAIAFLITSYSKILASSPSPSSLRQSLEKHLRSADTYKNTWTTISTIVANYVVPAVVFTASCVRDIASYALDDLRAGINHIITALGTPSDGTVDREGALRHGDRIASRVWTSVSTTSISYAQQAVDALGPLNPAYGPQRLRADVWEDEPNNTITAEIEVPGIAKPDIDINITDGKLVVTTKREIPDRGSVYLIQDRSHGQFELKIKLPAGTKGSDLKTGVSNGVLTISYPRVSANATERIKLE